MQAADYFDKNDDNYTKRPSDGTHVSNLNGDNECIESVPEKEYDDENPPPLFPNDWYNEHIHQPMVALVNNQNFQMCIIGLIIVSHFFRFVSFCILLLQMTKKIKKKIHLILPHHLDQFRLFIFSNK